MGPILCSEVRKAVNGLKSGKSTREGDIPIEFFKACALGSGAALQVLVDFCNDCLLCSTFPSSWLHARIAMIYKKGDPASCENYRPISVLAIGYKIFASILKQRLLDAGADKLLWHSQFGFRKHCSTSDAILLHAGGSKLHVHIGAADYLCSRLIGAKHLTA